MSVDSSLLAEGSHELIVEGLDQIGEHRSIASLHKRFDRHARQQFHVAETLDLIRCHGDANGVIALTGALVQTGADGKVGITFTDGTAFNLSSNARMVLNEFVYDPNGKSNSTLFSLSKGTFTFIAGKVAKTGDMKIDTPIATMGIRGTTPHVEISDDGTVKFSTLIEEKKNTVQENKNGAIEKRTNIDDNKRATKQRQTTRASSRYAASARQTEGNSEKNFDINFKICRGC